MVPLLGGDELQACGGSPPRLVEAVRAAVDGGGLAWPGNIDAT